jgi:hypothetical protein
VDPEQGSGIFLTLDPREKIRIRDKHPGSAIHCPKYWMGLKDSYMSNPPLEHLCGEVVCVAQISEAHHITAGLRILDHDDRGNHLKNKGRLLTG